MNNNIFYMNYQNPNTSYVTFNLANCCMPTLLKIKPANLVCFYKRYINEKYNFFLTLQSEINQFQADYEILYENECIYCILIYNYDLLNHVTKTYYNHKLMTDNNYYGEDLSFYMTILKRRYMNYMDKINVGFPHEIGIFLGYPIIDVEEYIKNKGENYLLSGYWKVYHNVNKAKKTFRYFSNVRESTLNLVNTGKYLKDINKINDIYK